MQIETLKQFSPASNDFLMIADDEILATPFTVALDNITVISADRITQPLGTRRVVLVAGSAELVEDAVQSDSSHVEYWMPRKHLDRMKLMDVSDQVIITGLWLDESWVYFELARINSAADENYRPADDLFTGIALGMHYHGSEFDIEDVETPEFTSTARSALLAAIFKAGKPVKRFLPSKLVAYLYKILNRVK